MKKRFVIAINDSTKDQDELFLEYIGTNNFGWWHWIDNFWLLVDSEGKITAKELHNNVMRIYSNNFNFVMEVKEIPAWWAYGAKEEHRNMFTWIEEHWIK